MAEGDGTATQDSSEGAALQARLEDGSLAGEWVLDPHASKVRFRTRTLWGLVPVKGVFGEVGGSATVSADGRVLGSVTVATASVDTRNRRRDDHLRSADFFDCANHPGITFAVEDVRPSDRDVTVTGTLTVRGRTRPLTVDAFASGDGGDELRLRAEVRVDRSDFGLTWNQLGMASTDNVLTVEAVFTRPRP